MTWTPRTQKPQEVKVQDAWPYSRPHPICVDDHCPILSCCQQAGRCLSGDSGSAADVKDARL
jgi:hypothetical protein